MKNIIETEAEYKNIDLTTSLRLESCDLEDHTDFNGGKNQSTFSIGRGGSGNVAMARDNYTTQEIQAHNEIFEILNG